MIEGIETKKYADDIINYITGKKISRSGFSQNLPE
jgi:hypothetical protein